MTKKLYSLLLTAMMTLTATLFTSCDQDTQIGLTLEGIWRGNMYVYTMWNGNRYNVTDTEITFQCNDFHWTRGTGYWVDYYSNAPWDYVANHIEWQVSGGEIRIYFREEGTEVLIRSYRLNDNRFQGTLWDNGQEVDFNLYHVASPRRSYDRWGYDGWTYYRSRQAKGTAADSTATNVPLEAPVRRFGW